MQRMLRGYITLLGDIYNFYLLTDGGGGNVIGTGVAASKKLNSRGLYIYN